jgi:hypothetical protein
MGDTFLIHGLKEKRAATAGRIADLRREADNLQAQLVHIDAVLKLYGLEAAEIPDKGHVPVRSAYFGRNEISKRCRDMIREKGTVKAADVAVQAMRDKGLDPDKDKAVKRDFVRRFLTTLHDLKRAGKVEQIGYGNGVQWRAITLPEDGADSSH